MDLGTHSKYSLINNLQSNLAHSWTMVEILKSNLKEGNYKLKSHPVARLCII